MPVADWPTNEQMNSAAALGDQLRLMKESKLIELHCRRVNSSRECSLSMGLALPQDSYLQESFIFNIRVELPKQHEHTALDYINMLDAKLMLR
jgi:serine protease inhibitor